MSRLQAWSWTLVCLLLAGGCVSTEPEDAVGGTARAPRATATSNSTGELVVDLPEELFIAHTDGDGVVQRDDCADEARASAPGEGIPEGSSVEPLEVGVGRCSGWMFTRAADGRESWVATIYLAHAWPSSPAPSGTASQGESAAGPGALFYGRVAPGARVAALIAGSTCGETTANASGEWAMTVRLAPCGAEPGKRHTVVFTINGRAARESAAWRNGLAVPDVVGGLTLTLR